MFYAVKANRSCVVTEEEFSKYLMNGYTIVNEFGAVVKEGVPTSTTKLASSFNQHTAEIEKLKAENAELKKTVSALKAEIKSLKTVPVNTVPVNEEKAEDVAEEEAPKPRRTRKKAE